MLYYGDKTTSKVITYSEDHVAIHMCVYKHAKRKISHVIKLVKLWNLRNGDVINSLEKYRTKFYSENQMLIKNRL